MNLSEQRQQQLIRNFIAGIPLPPEISIDMFDPDYFKIWTELNRATHAYGGDEYLPEALNYVGMSHEQLRSKIDDILALSSGQAFSWTTMEKKGRDTPPITWLWPNWIPRGHLSLLGAEKGMGKSNVALDFCMRLIHGMAAPDGGDIHAISRNVIYIDAEGFFSGLYERAVNWGMDMSRVYMFEWPEDEILNLGTKKTKGTLIDMCIDLKPDLIVVDSFSDVQVRGENKVEDIRDVLSFLPRLVRTFGCAMLILHHLRKPQGMSNYDRVTIHDIRGSSHISIKSRSIMALWKETDHQKQKQSPVHVECIATNLGVPPSPLYLHFYHPDPEDHDKYEILYEPIPDPEKQLPENLTGKCAEWLLDELAAEPLPYSKIVANGKKAGFRENTIQNARRALGWKVIDTIGPKRRGNKWALHIPTDDNQPEEEPGISSPENEPTNGASANNGHTHTNGYHSKPAQIRPIWERLPPNDRRLHPLHRGPNGHPSPHPLLRAKQNHRKRR